MSEEEKEPKNPELTPEQLATLEAFASNIQVDNFTVSFSLEGRNFDGEKKSVFLSANVTPKPREGGGGYSLEEMTLAHAIVSRRVVATVYEDAMLRGIIPSSVERKAEKNAILAFYSKKAKGLLEVAEKAGK